MIRFLSIPAMLSLLYMASSAALAQAPVPGEIGAVKIVDGAIMDTNAYMGFGLTKDGGESFVGSAATDEDVEIRGEIHPEPDHVGATGSLFLVIRLEDNSWVMKDEAGNWRVWNVKFSDLVPFRTEVALEPVVNVTFLSGMISQFTGRLRLFLAYAGPDGTLQFNPVPYKVVITGQSNEAAAFALFEDNILPNIIFGSCVTCHNDGSTFFNGTQFNAPYQYVLPNEPDYVNINFGVISTLLASRGREYILDKASGRILHYGGTQLPADSQQYMDFDTFLMLLEK